MNNNSALRDFSALVDFSNLINSNLDLKFTLNNILLTCFGKFHTSKGIIALIDYDNILKIRAFKGLEPKIIEDFPEIKITENKLNATELKDFLSKYSLPICQEIISVDGFKGIIILGNRLTKVDYSNEDIEFLTTLVNIGATAIENSVIVDKLKIANRSLDSKVNQLSSLFDLSKEFSGVLEVNMIGKLLVFSIIGQLLVSKFAVVTEGTDKLNYLENKFKEDELFPLLSIEMLKDITFTLTKSKIKKDFPQLTELGIELIIPMQIKGITKGLILLGGRKNSQSYTTSDVEFAASVGSLAIISIENARLFAETLEKERMEKDLSLAKSIQENLLPNKIPSTDFYEISAINNTARHVGGDYYDVVKLDDERTLIAIADVSGKGVQAALLMANMQAFLKSICKQNIPLDEASNLINDLVSENTSGGSFITFFWGILNSKTKELEFVNAGHNPPLLIRNGEIDYLKKGGMILGVMETVVPYVSRTYKLEPGDAIILFTDGITEAMDTNHKEYSDERLEELVVKHANKSSEEILNEILTDVEDYTKDAEQSDDITSLIVKVK